MKTIVALGIFMALGLAAAYPSIASLVCTLILVGGLCAFIASGIVKEFSGKQ
jgi:hypothetical protein